MTKSLSWKGAIWAGIIAGVVFMMLEMALIMMLKGMSPWGPPRMMAAMVMGEGVLPSVGEPATFDFGVMMVAMMTHLMLSTVLAIVLGFGISRLGLNLVASIIVGAIVGMTVYFVDFYVFTAWFPWFGMSRGVITLFSHAMFGAVAGGVYQAIAGKAEPAPKPTEA